MTSPDPEVVGFRAPHERGGIEVSGVSHDFINPDGEPVRAISDITLSVAQGEFVAIVGPSGCGKSTLLNLISGLISPTAGTIEVGGSRIGGVHKDVGYMPARDSLLPWRTSSQNVSLPLELQGIGDKNTRAARAKELLESVGLGGYERHFPSAMSHGMRQRTAVARTFATKPAVLLMDEPFSALDAQTKVAVQDLFLGIWEAQKQTVLLITHDVMEAVALADRVVVMSPRPGVIRAVHEIDLPRPRSVKHLLFDEPKFQEYLRRIWKDLDV